MPQSYVIEKSSATSDVNLSVQKYVATFVKSTLLNLGASVFTRSEYPKK